MLSEKFSIINLFGPTADGFNGGPSSDVINMGKADRVNILFAHKGGTTGTGKVQVYAGDSVAPSNGEAVVFKYRKKTTGASDTWGAVTDAVAATGFTTVAGEDTIYDIQVDGADLPADKPYAYLLLTEVVNDPVVVQASAVMNARYPGLTQPTALT